MYHIDKKLIFTHPHKCGGTSIEDSLGFLILREQYTSITPIKHASLEEHFKILTGKGLDTNQFFKFSIIRNPWDRAVSFYNHCKYKAHSSFVLQGKENELPRYVEDARQMTFKEYVLTNYKRTFNSDRNTKPYMLIQDNFCLDYVIKLENFKADISNINDKLGIDLSAGLPHLNNADKFLDRKHYSEYYDEETIDFIGNLFEWDIKTFDYKFESEGTLI